jgi:phage FluMu gp28-like protein
MFTPQEKEEMAMGVKEGLEKTEFLLQNDRKFQRQIHSIKRIATSGGNVRYDSERDEDGHADSFWAWALANSAVPKAGVKEDFYAQWRKKRNAETAIVKGEITDDIKSAPVQKGKSANRLLRQMGMK